MKNVFFLFFLSPLLLLSCQNSKAIAKNINTVLMKKEIIFSAGPQAVVYQTTKDYANLVPVIMDSEKKKIVSYPAPTDVFYRGVLAKPTALKNGYLLDNRGINENVVFLNYTYEEYSHLPEAPSLDEMLFRIVDKYPLKELINCGLRSQYKDEIKELNALIDANFAGCKRIKIKSFNVMLEQ